MTVFAAPRAALACAFAMIVLCLASLPWYPSGLSYFVFGCVMLQPRRRHDVWRYFATLAVLNTVLLAYAHHLAYPWQTLMWMPTVTAIIGVIVMAERHNGKREAALRLSHEEVRRLAALAERERIGRDLHDLLGHTLSMVALKSDLAARLIERDPAAARREIADVSRVSREALAQVRRAVSGIRAAGLAAELASAKLLLETDGIEFDYRLDSAFSNTALSDEVESALAMTVREAATNIQRHAHAHRASIDFTRQGGAVVLQITDDGIGSANTPGNGLTGMRERLEAVGGAMRIDSPRGAGTCIHVRIELGPDQTMKTQVMKTNEPELSPPSPMPQHISSPRSHLPDPAA